MSTIPKTIHYIWFGKNPKSDLVLKCISSWKKYLPDYEIVEWNEDNYDVNKNKYISEAYSCKKWAFVSDYVRFDILNRFGGIYLDTDVEMLKSLPDEFLNNTAFTGMESTGDIAPGLIWGSVAGHPFLQRILENYEESSFIVNGKEMPITVNARITEMIMESGYIKSGLRQKINDIMIYESEIFCGYDLDVFEPHITQNTISMHHYSSSWAYGSFKIKRRLQICLKKIVGIDNYRKVLELVRKYRH